MLLHGNWSSGVGSEAAGVGGESSDHQSRGVAGQAAAHTATAAAAYNGESGIWPPAKAVDLCLGRGEALYCEGCRAVGFLKLFGNPVVPGLPSPAPGD